MFNVNPWSRRFRRIVAALLCLATLLPPQLIASDSFDGHWFRVRGRWNGLELQAQSLQLRESEDDPSDGQISGIVDVIDPRTSSFSVGPFTIHWSEKTTFEGEAENVLHEGSTVKVSGRLREPFVFEAKSIKLETDPYGLGVIQVTGLTSNSRIQFDGSRKLDVMGVPVYTTQGGYNIAKSLTRRQDARRPDDQLRFEVHGRPLTIGGEYSVNPFFRDNLDLDSSEADASLRLSQELKLELFYPFSDFTILFLSVKGVGQSDFNYDGRSEDEHEYQFARDETWVYFERAFDLPFSVQFGRQNVADIRGWWWDKDLDAMRIYHDNGPFHFELTGGQQIGAESTLRSIDQVEADVTRVLGVASWMWASKQRLELYGLSQWDHSIHDSLNSLVRNGREDDSDADLVWVGGRAIGDRNLGKYGALLYWGDFAFVRGRERLFEFDDSDDRFSRTSGIARRTVRGFGFDAGASWTLPVALEPTVTVSYARGSGDGDLEDGTDHSFRQTGLHRNKWRFRGVNRFRFYGELVRPDLSNIGIFTAALGVPLLRNSSLELVYHKYDQVKASTLFRGSRLDEDPNGVDRDLGYAADVVLNFREYKQLEFGLIGSMFAPGSAFGSKTAPAYGVQTEVVFNF